MNESGIKPVEYKVLIKPVKVEEKTQGGIVIPETLQEKEKYATQKGHIVAIGAIAFTGPDWLDRPAVGNMVMFDRYAGGLVKGQDGEEYRLFNDKEICAVLTETE